MGNDSKEKFSDSKPCGRTLHVSISRSDPFGLWQQSPMTGSSETREAGGTRLSESNQKSLTLILAS